MNKLFKNLPIQVVCRYIGIKKGIKEKSLQDEKILLE